MKQARFQSRLLGSFEENFEGLEQLKMVIQRQETPDGRIGGGEIQRFDLKRGSSDLTPTDLCRIVWLRGERYVRKSQYKTQFRVHFIGTDADGTFNHQCRFTISVADLLETSHVDDDEGEGDDDDEEDEDEESEDEEDEDEEGDDEEDEEEEEEDDDDDKENWSDESSGPAPLVPVGTQRVAVSGDTHYAPQQLNPHYITHLVTSSQGSALRLAERAFLKPMEENRRMLSDMRKDNSAVITDLKAMAEMLLRESNNMRRADREFFEKIIDTQTRRMEVLEGQLNEQNKLNHRQYENLQELAKQGWVAFLDAMRMKSEVVDERIEWAKFLADEAERTAVPAPIPEAPRGPSGLTSIVQSAMKSPSMVGGLAMIMRRRGSVQDAEFLEDLARRMASGGEEDDDEDEEDDDDVVDASATPSNGSSHSSEPFVGHAAGPAQAPCPFADRIRAFRSSFSRSKLRAIRKAMPQVVWDALERACATQDDRVAVQCILQMDREFSKDQTAMLGLLPHFTEDQAIEIQEAVKEAKAIAKAAGRRAPPRRPGPQPSA